ncbi:MAG: family beta-propeller repeat protein [Planctomycetota bacterium]|nr:family beta-propeller repeat protein [Planctomycetota bacterium]
MRMIPSKASRLMTGLALSAVLALFALARPNPSGAGDPPTEKNPSPIALALAADGSRLLVANQGTGTVALVDPAAGKVVAEVATGDRPAGVAIDNSGKRAVVTHWFGYDVAILEIANDAIKVVGRVEVGPEPRGVAISPDGTTAFVAVGASNEVVRLDLDARKVSGRLTVGREPRGVAITPDGARLVVGNARGKSVSVVSVGSWAVEREVPIEGDNLRQVAVSADGKTGYVVNMRNRGFATTRNNIDIGWVLGQRLTKVSLDGSAGYATLSLDPEGKAAGDVHGIAISQDGKTLAVSSGGTHEVLLFREDATPLPWRANGSRDLIAPELLRNDGRFRRVPLGGRPTELAYAPDGKTLYIANYLGDSVQVVDTESATLTKTIALGGPSEPSLARKGEALFHDATRSFNQWYSCNTCHSDGHTNGLDFDTMNDGWQDFSLTHKRSRKKVPTLRGVAKTGPWTWHGWQTSLSDAVVESFTKSMQGPRPTSEDVTAVVAFLETLEFPRNPHRERDGSLSASARRGEAVFRSPKAACSSCHGGAEFTDGKIHQVGLEDRGDVYSGYNPPSLKGIYDKDPYLHDGRARTLRDALTKGHVPEEVTGLGSLSDGELDDLIAYLKSL